MSDGNEDKTTLVSITSPTGTGTSKREEPYLVVLSGGPVGMMYRLPPGEDITIGRSPDAGIRFEDQSVSRQHAKITVVRNQGVILEDLGSTNGTFVNGERIEKYTLSDGDKIGIGQRSVLKFCYQDDIERTFQQELFVRGIKDGLTATYNKQYLLDRIEAEFVHAQRHQGTLATLMFDIDYFKKINDTHGHPAGDFILQELVSIISPMLRAEDVFARFGGDEFVVLTREVNDAGVVVLAQRIRRAIKRHNFDFDGTSIPITISLGIATLSDKVKRAADLIKVADRYLYKAKNAGRNCISGGRGVKSIISELSKLTAT